MYIDNLCVSILSKMTNKGLKSNYCRFFPLPLPTPFYILLKRHAVMANAYDNIKIKFSPEQEKGHFLLHVY